MAKKLALFGAGNIGSVAIEVLAEAGYEISAVVGRRSIRTFGPNGAIGDTDLRTPGDPNGIAEQLCSMARFDGVVAAMPGGDGEFEASLATAFVCERKIPFTSAAKVWLAKYFDLFEPHLGLIGRMATVGGGTMMLDFMGDHLDTENGQDSIVHAVANGTMSYVMTNRWRNRSLLAILHECEVLKLAEPTPKGQKPNVMRLMTGEIEDVIWKLMIILDEHYRKRIGRTVRREDFVVNELTDIALQRYLAPNARRKFVIRITTSDVEPEIGIADAGSIWARIEGKVFVSAGFYEIPFGSALAQWVPDIGPGNAVHIEQGGNQAVTSGDGAGPYATCKSILHDVKSLVPLRETMVQPAFGAARHHPRRIPAVGQRGRGADYTAEV